MSKARERRAVPADLALRGRIGAHLLHARYDSRLLTAPADERRRRAAHLRAAHFARLARLSALARRQRAARRRNQP